MTSSPRTPLLAFAAPLFCLLLGAADARARGNDDPRGALAAGVIEIDARDAGVGERVADLEFVDLDGAKLQLTEAAGPSGLVIATRQIGCPVSESNGSALARLEREYAARGIGFLYVHVGPAPEPETVRAQELDAFGFAGPYALDEGGTLGRALGLEASSAVFLLDGARTLQYRGTLDDRHRAGAAPLSEPTREYLRDALESVLSRQLVVVPATRAPGSPLDLPRVEPRQLPEDISFHREVARIFQSSCVECHHEGGAGPFVLSDYETAYDKRRMIGLVVEERIMPPWYAIEPHGTWKDDRRLTDYQRETVLAWVEQGAPAGDPADAPIPLEWSSGWVIGEPDEIFQLNAVQEIPAEGVIDYRLITADRRVDRDMWIERMQVLPTDKSVVHHASAFYREPQAQLPGSLAETLLPWTKKKRAKYGAKKLLWGYAPGRPAGTFDPGVARFLPKGSLIAFEMHYTTQGTATTDRTRIGLVLAREKSRLVAETHALFFKDIDIGPGERLEYTMDYEFERPVRLRSLVPHMHYRGSYFTSDLFYPDGREQRLIDIPEWDFDWQHTYVFNDGPLVPKGARIRMTGGFDNSTANTGNPDPSRRVPYGVQSWDEMLKLGVEWVRPVDPADPVDAD